MRFVFRRSRAAGQRAAIGGVVLTGTFLVAASAHPQTPPLLPAAFADDTLAMGLDEPNSMAFLPDGRLVFTELKNGRIRMIVGDHVAASDPLVVVDNLNAEGNERGLQGIAVDPRWPGAPYVYTAYTRTGEHTVLVRYTASGELDDPAGESLALGDPLVVLGGIRDAYENHNGLGLRFDRDGYLLFSLGEDSNPCAAQRVDSLGGKLLRLDITRLPAAGGGPVPRALLVPPDPVFAGPDSNALLVHAYGLRNPWRFHVDPVDGTIALADVGWNQFEEVNDVVRGGNYGWPYLEGSVPGPSVGCPPDSGAALLAPIATWVNGVSSIAIHTAGIYRPVPTGTHNWPPEYWGNVLYGDYYHSRLRRLRRSGGVWEPAPPVLGQPTADDFARGLFWSVDFLVGPDGSLYWLKAWDNSYRPSSGMLRRIRYTGGAVAVADAPGMPVLRVVPNPFRDRVSFVTTGAAPGPFDITIVDVGGRRIRRLSSPMPVPLVWDGRDEDGRAVPPGLYLVRPLNRGAAATVRVLRIH